MHIPANNACTYIQKLSLKEIRSSGTRGRWKFDARSLQLTTKASSLQKAPELWSRKRLRSTWISGGDCVAGTNRCGNVIALSGQTEDEG